MNFGKIMYPNLFYWSNKLKISYLVNKNLLFAIDHFLKIIMIKRYYFVRKFDYEFAFLLTI